ncbi:bacillithiol system redox-active protein YtxJ [Maribacter sp. ACAM166]|uniref:bacillithiol system redox-active protein YtxJ n=1 Tax=Maribacter sp. ACAM166 TaxID=2508996 RepID=UPI0010FE946F|nr:bacillithiol system redox-active protein YtxJ [Maribacter sp. ACAM166]TLP81301.1 bacillithiol system redox-active protein YtxJ [Maribacter sp. ACAM166]
MGLFSGLFGGTKEDGKRDVSEIPWISLSSIEQLEEIKEESGKRPQVIFKHSTTCGISRMALNMFKSGYGLEEGQMNFYFLDLRAHRDVSNAVASEFGIQHQSPQLLILKNGLVVMQESHGAIADIKLEQYI